MAKTLQFRRYDSTALATITGANGEIIMDSTANTLTVHNGYTAGGFRLSLSKEANVINIFTQSAFTQANAANILAQAAYNQGNTANLIANTAAANISILFSVNSSQNTWISSNATLTQAAYTQANSANILAQGAFTQANSAFDKANSANVIAQAAFNAANSGSSVLAQSSFNQANAANILAQSAFTQANSANVLAQAAFNAANSASITFTQAAFDKANASNVLAQSAYNQGNTANLIANTASANITILYGINTTQNTWIASNAVFTQSAYTFANTVNVFTQAAYTQANTATTGLASKAAYSGYTANTVLYSNTTGYVASSSNLTYDGTNLSVSGNVKTNLVKDSLNNVLAPASARFTNRLINGAMVIDQRNAGASVTPTATGFTLDRWSLEIAQASKLSVQQNAGSVTPPVGFVNYLGITTVSAYSVGTSEVFDLRTFIEGYNVADLGWGTANAKTVTLSFQVYSSLTGTFGGALRNNLNNRSYPFSYSIPVANTWTSISVTVAGDTTGTWEVTNQRGITVLFGLGCGATVSGTAGSWSATNYSSATGATSVVGTNGATFYITGVQLEVGTNATNFDYRFYGTELALCQRYYETSWYGSAVGVDSSAVATTGYYGTSDSLGSLWFSWRVTKRTQPTAYIWSPLTTSCANKIRQANNGTIATISGLTVYGNVASFGGALASLNYQFGWSMDAEL